MNYNYQLTVTNVNGEHIIKTNDVQYAIHEMLKAIECDCQVCLCNGYTGEVLCHNGDEPYCTTEMALMVAGFLALNEDEELSDPEETAGDLVMRMIGEMVSEDEDTAPVVPADGVIADPLQAMLETLVAQGKAIKLGGLPS